VTVQVTLVPVGGVSIVKLRVSQPLVPVSPVGLQFQRNVTAAECHASHCTGESPTLQEGATLSARAVAGSARTSTASNPATNGMAAMGRLRRDGDVRPRYTR
jgi:hypothetical protein